MERHQLTSLPCGEIWALGSRERSSSKPRSSQWDVPTNAARSSVELSQQDEHQPQQLHAQTEHSLPGVATLLSRLSAIRNPSRGSPQTATVVAIDRAFIGYLQQQHKRMQGTRDTRLSGASGDRRIELPWTAAPVNGSGASVSTVRKTSESSQFMQINQYYCSDEPPTPIVTPQEWIARERRCEDTARSMAFAQQSMQLQRLPRGREHQQDLLHNTHNAHEDDDTLLTDDRHSRKRSFPAIDRAPPCDSGSSHKLVPAAEPSTSDVSATGVGKASRYLREMDRHVILSRIARGEKQSALAKEFHVSRAAICNLNKHRDEVLSRKDTENPLAKHPKKPRLATRVPWSAVPASQPAQRYPSLQQANSVKPELFHSYHTMIGGQMTSTTSSLEVQTRGSEPVEPASRSAAISFSTSKYDPPRLHKLQSRSIALMLTMARARNASVTDFRRYSDRLMRLVIEHAMALAPMESVLNISSDTESSGGYSSVHPPCGIAIHPSGVPMFDIFRSMEPAQPAGVVHVSSTTHTNPPGATRRKLSLSAQTLLPASLNNYNVFVFDVALQDRQSLGLVVETLRLLLRERGACEKRLWVVALSISSQSITSLQSLFPELQIVTVTVTECAPIATSAGHVFGTAPRGLRK